MTNSRSARLARYLDIICDFGGRRTGSDSERAASEWLGAHLARTGGRVGIQDDNWSGWRPLHASVEIDGESHKACALLNVPATPADGLIAEVLDLGRGTPDDFATHADQIAGRIVLVQHERMFSATTVHRRIKYTEAVDRGAAGLLVVGHRPGSTVAGSSGMSAGEGIPAAGIAPETAAKMIAAGRAKLRLGVEMRPATARSHVIEFGPTSGPVVLLSAHLDGHDPGDAALDNASGVAILLSLVEEFSARPALSQRLRFCFFNLEEWHLTGSRNYVAGLSAAEREEIAVNINLDSLGVPGPMTALTSGFEKLGPFLTEAFATVGEELNVHLPLQVNSDHANFAQAGIPAFRLFGGFDDPQSTAMAILSEDDRREIVSLPDLARAERAIMAVIERASGLCSQAMHG
ncbi:M28 family peptidase [Haematobacter genomosp. 1]|uniref:Carboxypeptidase Q n=1 Tax=Haematobacter genomosp. 1 TaxID=366618 RepID=A0A212A6L1_9RHOB|nr:M28 family peptidase [Haematobacter genomosp. 1]OWJ74814.1 hypothetical protein CDV49_18670 [Haematobacter genomosp. 1]